MCSQCKSTMERYRRSVGHTHANMDKQNFLYAATLIYCYYHYDYNLAEQINKYPNKLRELTLTFRPGGIISWYNNVTV